MSNELIIRKAELDDVNTIGYLAYQIWPVTYRDLLTFDRLQYMLNLIYSPASLRRQMTTDLHQFLLAELNDEPVGFASYSKIDLPDTYKLHKLYVSTNIQGKGLGKALLDQVKANALSAGARFLHLNVKRDNKAIHFYEKQGFKIIREEDIDIGNGYFMNDYVMELSL
jgi:diamine N-acetyltransferase